MTFQLQYGSEAQSMTSYRTASHLCDPFARSPPVSTHMGGWMSCTQSTCQHTHGWMDEWYGRKHDKCVLCAKCRSHKQQAQLSDKGERYSWLMRRCGSTYLRLWDGMGNTRTTSKAKQKKPRAKAVRLNLTVVAWLIRLTVVAGLSRVWRRVG